MKKGFLLILSTMLFFNLSIAQTISGTWTGELAIGLKKLAIVFHFNKTANNSTKVFMDVPAQSAKGIPVNLHVLTTDSVSLAIPSIGMTYSGKLHKGVIVGTFTQMGQQLKLDLYPGNQARKSRPQEPKGDLPYTTLEMSVHNEKADVYLTGTLTYPTGFMKDSNMPVVVMVTGSGGQNRDEEIFEHKPFLVIADYLARNGIASFRYDDRGMGKSSGTQIGCTSADFADDAEVVIDFLRKKGEFKKIGILGHSEGGMIAFMLGARNKVDFIVSMAGPGIKGDTLLTEQKNAILRLQGIDLKITTEQTRKEIATMTKNVWLEYFLNYDPRVDLEKITVPIMAINGTNDVQVLSKSNLKAIRDILYGKNKYNLIKEYPNLNHLFQHCTPQTAIDYYEIDETCSNEVLEDIVNWIKSLK